MSCAVCLTLGDCGGGEPFCWDGGYQEEGQTRTEVEEVTGTATKRLLKCWLLGMVFPRPQQGLMGSAVSKSSLGPRAAPEPCLLQGPEIPWCRLTTGRKEFTKNRQQQILAFLLSLSTGRVPLVALPRGLGRLAKPQGEAMPHDC